MSEVTLEIENEKKKNYVQYVHINVLYMFQVDITTKMVSKKRKFKKID